MCRYLFKFFILSFLLSGCVVSEPSVLQTKTIQLATLLHSLGQSISRDEAMYLSQDIFYKTHQLTKDFKLTAPPQFHNFLVNIGLREKGLCYHWSDALYLYMSAKKYPSFEFHLLGANIGEYWYEHNVLVVVVKGGRVKNGIILDPWRNSGKLYFSKVEDDLMYEWKHRAIRGCQR